MSRRKRMHVSGAYYYIVSQRNLEQPPFFKDPNDYSTFETVLAETIQKYDAKVHAFCWMPRAIHLIVKVSKTPTSRVMQRLLSQYARRSRKQRRGEAKEPSVQSRYHAVLFDHEEFLSKLVHYLHWLPALEAEVGSPEGYEHSSHRHYAGRTKTPWLSVLEVLNTYAPHPKDARSEYRHRMMTRPDPEDIKCFENAASCHAEVLGGQMFRCRLPPQFPVHRSRVTLDQIIDSTSLRFGVHASDVRGGVRAKGLALVRAVIAWHATERRIAKLEEVATALKRSAPTLLQAIKRHQERKPELFNVAAFSGAISLASMVPIGLTPCRASSLDLDDEMPSSDEATVRPRHEAQPRQWRSVARR